MASALARESQQKHREASYHYFHGQHGGEAPVVEPQVSAREAAAGQQLSRLTACNAPRRATTTQKLTPEEAEALAARSTSGLQSAWNQARRPSGRGTLRAIGPSRSARARGRADRAHTACVLWPLQRLGGSDLTSGTTPGGAADLAQAGTFEERNWTAWAKSRLQAGQVRALRARLDLAPRAAARRASQELLVGITVPLQPCGTLRTTELATCSGDATARC